MAEPPNPDDPDHLDLLLTIRFSASIPDILLSVPDPTHLTAAGLKQLIRQRLPKNLFSHRLRLIYAGRALDDATSLASALNIPELAAKAKSSSEEDKEAAAGYDNGGDEGEGDNTTGADNDNHKGKGKGKAVIRDPPTPQLRTYIHCSIGDIVLSAAELEAEARMARVGFEGEEEEEEGMEADALLGPSSSSWSKRTAHARGRARASAHGAAAPGPFSSSSAAAAAAAAAPTPRGFDSLIDTGFTPGEVSMLRSQFLALHSISRTPDTMPSGTELRRLEERWLEEEGPAGGAGTGELHGSGGAGAGGNGEGDDGSGTLDDMLWGSMMGFFWPVGCGLWLLRESGVWSWRKGLAVFVGVVVNFGFGVVRVVN
ncbi:hypothetical protein AJ79_08907 [Helicocarpus griseus UAMH5409]|uniref:Ubiquitin-like domain-containing protein n=1 Tax=Helicocarpus griseus UAMH5409 TaxID=1447875 RepID=A0A2B7WPA1_9EURO|nr:hypothetical protein AJ79_08907 [Helicocarpus griseus UAMH5409]